MTAIQSTYMSFSFNNINTIPALGLFDAGKPGSTASQDYGDAFSLDLSSDAMGMLSGSDDSRESPHDLLMEFIDRVLSSTGHAIHFAPAARAAKAYQAGQAARPEVVGYPYNHPFLQGGPLPAFLAIVDKRLNLSAEKSIALREIAIEFKDAPRSLDTVKNIKTALDNAGIG